MTISLIATGLLFASVGIYAYEYFAGKVSAWAKGVQSGLLATSLYLFAIHHLFISGVIWLGAVSIIIATILVVQTVYYD